MLFASLYGMASEERVQREIDRNYAAFTEMLPGLMKTSAGKWALLCDKSLVAVFDTARDAQLAGEKIYPDAVFSVQEVRGRAIDLGWFSHAVSERTVQS